MAKKKEFTIAVLSCARCGKDHPRVLFKKFTRPVKDDSEGILSSAYTHWGMCPNKKEPILLTIVAKR